MGNTHVADVNPEVSRQETKINERHTQAEKEKKEQIKEENKETKRRENKVRKIK
jgi:hypothetical protein